MVSNSIGIIGCGWLGQALLKTLLKRNMSVKVTYQTSKTKSILEDLGTKPEQLSLPITKAKEPHIHSLDQHTIIIAIPPKYRTNKDYVNNIKQLVKLCEQHKAQHIILISSTAVYAGRAGILDESTSISSKNKKASFLHQAEQHVAQFSKHSSVLRLAGLVGSSRHPSNFIKSGKIFDNPENPVNLIHQDDAVGLLLKLCEQPMNTTDKYRHSIFNGVSNTHCSKKSFYHKAAQVKNKPMPEFNDKHTEQGRIISSKFTREQLDYQYQWDDLTDWLTAENNATTL